MDLDWPGIIKSLDGGDHVSTDPSRWDLTNPGYLEIYDRWAQAGFNMSAIGWINYYPGRDFDQQVIDHAETCLGIKTHRAWISRINPGYMAPPHWDVDDREKEYLQQGHILRKTIIMHQFDLGQILIIDGKYYNDLRPGSVIHWNHYRDTHSAANASLTGNYLLHIVGRDL
jgi:hypothetical protein